MYILFPSWAHGTRRELRENSEVGVVNDPTRANIDMYVLGETNWEKR